MRQVNLRLEESLLAAVDGERGLVSRNRWIVDVLERAMNPVVRVEGPRVESKRSPEPEKDLEPPREVESKPAVEVPGVVRASSLAKRSLDRPIVQKRGGGS